MTCHAVVANWKTLMCEENGRLVSRLLCCGYVCVFPKQNYYANLFGKLLVTPLRLYCAILFNVYQLQIVDEDKRLAPLPCPT